MSSEYSSSEPSQRLAHDLASQADQSLRQRAEQLRADYAREGDTEFVEDANAATGGLLGGQSWAQLLAPDGALVKTSGNGLSIVPVFGTDMVRSVLDGGTRMMTIGLGPHHQLFRLIARPLGAPGHRTILVLATSLDLLDAVVRQLTELLVLAGVMTVALAGTSGWGCRGSRCCPSPGSAGMPNASTLITSTNASPAPPEPTRWATSRARSMPCSTGYVTAWRSSGG